jgi:sugar phosphate isomerase/epimerase
MESTMVTLSALADEISPDLTEQMDALEREGIKHLELRGVWHKGVLELGNAELDQLAFALDERDFSVSAIASPIGKTLISDDFDKTLKSLQKAFDVAGFFGAEYVRIFSFYIPAGDAPEQHRDEVMRRLDRMATLAEDKGIVLLCENEKGIYGDIAARCRDIMDTIDSPMLRSLFDFANFVQAGQHPHDECFLLLRDRIEYLHVKDALLATGQVKPIGEGDAEAKRILTELIIDDGFEGFLSIEPHLKMEKTEAFATAARALKRLLEEIWSAYA